MNFPVAKIWLAVVVACTLTGPAAFADYCRAYTEVFQCGQQGGGNETQSNDWCRRFLSEGVPPDSGKSDSYWKSAPGQAAIERITGLCETKNFNDRRRAFCRQRAPQCTGAGTKPGGNASCSESARDCVDKAGQVQGGAQQNLGQQSQDLQSTVTGMQSALQQLQSAALGYLDSSGAAGGTAAPSARDQALLEQAFGGSGGHLSLSDASGAEDPGTKQILRLAVAAQELQGSAQDGLSDVAGAQNALSGMQAKSSENGKNLDGMVAGHQNVEASSASAGKGSDLSFISSAATSAGAGAGAGSAADAGAQGKVSTLDGSSAVSRRAAAPDATASDRAAGTAAARDSALRDRLAQRLREGRGLASGEGGGRSAPGATGPGLAQARSPSSSPPTLSGSLGPKGQAAPGFAMNGSENDAEIHRLLGEWGGHPEERAAAVVPSAESVSLFTRVHHTHERWSAKTRR